MHKILIVDDDPTTTISLKNYLSGKGYSIETANSAISGAELMRNKKFSLVISDINMPEISGLDFFLWIKKHSPKSQVILMTAYGSEEIRNFVKTKGALQYIEKPVNLLKLTELIKKNIHQGFSGNIHEINLFDIIQIIILSKKAKLILVTDKVNHQSGKLFIKFGKIIHSEFNDLQGEEAFFAIMNIKNGIFSDLPWFEPEKITINKSYISLLVKAARNIEKDNNDKSGQKFADKINFAKNINSEKVLIVDDDLITLLILEKYFSEKGFFTVTASSAIEGAAILKSESFALVITDINMPGINGIEFLLWIKQHSPRSKVIMITGVGSSEIKKFVNNNGAFGYFEKPVDFNQLDQFIKKNLETNGFSGNIQEIDIIDFIQIISFSGTNKLISVIDPVINKSGLIFIKDSRIVHAECSDLMGEEAFYSLIKLKSGIFSDLPWIEPKEITINKPITNLLINASIIKYQDNKEIITEEFSSGNPGNSLVRAKPKYLEKALEQLVALENFKEEKDPIKKLTIYESGVALGLVLGRSDKNEVISIMKKYSNVDSEIQRENQMFYFEDLSLNILFNDFDIVEEFTFGKLYKGATSLGIQIGDPIEKAIELYGKPMTCTVKGAVWDNIAFFCPNTKIITTIRIRNLNFFNNSREMLVNNPDLKIIQEKPKQIYQDEGENILMNNIKNMIRPYSIIKKSAKKKRKSLIKELALISSVLNNNQSEKNIIPKSKSESNYSKIKRIKKPKNYTIYESGMALNILIGITTMDEVKEILSNYSKNTGEINYSKKILYFEDISLNVLFDNNKIVKELMFGESYPGITSKGIKIGDSFEKAIEVYGNPNYLSEKNAIWNIIAVYGEDKNKISSIRLKKL